MEPSILAETTRLVAVSKLKEHPDNPRRGDVEAIKESIRANGFFAPLVVRRATGHVLAGNHRLKAALALGMKKLPVAYVDVDAKTAKRILLADNRASDFADYDDGALLNLLQGLQSAGDLLGSLYTPKDINDLLKAVAGGDGYTGKVTSPTYEPSNKKPRLMDLTDDTKTQELEAKIAASGLPSAEKAFLREAAQRHRVFRYDRIADFYAHSNREVQELMEQSALVIIDFDKAIELGFVKLSKAIAGLYAKDGGDED